MSENKTGKYLKYAIGEIILVVIGILIALQINNWNEARKNEKRIIGYMINLVEDLKSDVNLFNENLMFYDVDIKGNEFILTSDAFKQLDVDSILKLVTNVYLIDRSTRQTYEKIKNEGLIESLGSKKINNAINTYYNIDIVYYQNILKWDKEYTDKGFDFWFLNKNYEVSSVRDYNTNALPFLTSATKRKADLITLIESIEGRNHIRGSLIRKKHAQRRVTEIKQSAEDLIEMLNKELEGG